MCLLCTGGGCLRHSDSVGACVGDADGFSAIFETSITTTSHNYGNYLFSAMFDKDAIATVIIDDGVAFVWHGPSRLGACTALGAPSAQRTHSLTHACRSLFRSPFHSPLAGWLAGWLAVLCCAVLYR